MTDKDNKVGYKNPPKSTQFKPGQSGNPKGRPKGLKNLSTDLKDELEEKIVVTEGGKTLELTKQRAMLKTLMAKALKGDTKAANSLITLTLGIEQSESSRSGQELLPEEDQAILASLKARLLEAELESLTEDKTSTEQDDIEENDDESHQS